jgi:hypothetical protein
MVQQGRQVCARGLTWPGLPIGVIRWRPGDRLCLVRGREREEVTAVIRVGESRARVRVRYRPADKWNLVKTLETKPVNEPNANRDLRQSALWAPAAPILSGLLVASVQTAVQPSALPYQHDRTGPQAMVTPKVVTFRPLRETEESTLLEYHVA